VRADPEGVQVVGQLVNPGIEAVIAQLLCAKGHSHGIGRLRDLRLEELHKRLIQGRLVALAVPLP
jgi:hypothetical protein